MENFSQISHIRYNALTGEKILVSPHRTQRPWQGQQEIVERNFLPEHDKNCYLCTGNLRAGGIQNPDYKDTFVFTNDFSALLPNISYIEERNDELFTIHSERGICRVVCFSPLHNKTISELSVASVKKVIDLWQNEYCELAKNDFLKYVQIFENKGTAMGCSNPHPHCQIWATETIPQEALKEDFQQKKYFEKHKKSLLFNYLDSELIKQERIVYENSAFVVLVPFWAVWPFETIIISRRHFQHIGQMNEDEKLMLAEAWQRLSEIYDKVFHISFPYSSGVHQAPVNMNDIEHWHFHLHFFPPLLRSATVRKFMVGYEMFGNPQRDITPESSAKILKEIGKTFNSTM